MAALRFEGCLWVPVESRKVRRRHSLAWPPPPTTTIRSQSPLPAAFRIAGPTAQKLRRRPAGFCDGGSASHHRHGKVNQQSTEIVTCYDATPLALWSVSKQSEENSAPTGEFHLSLVEGVLPKSKFSKD